jgi:hypothetical protein
MIPIIIISFNNYKYIDNTIKQICSINPEYLASIIIMDNCSVCEKTKEYLKNTSCKVIYNEENHGPWVNSRTNLHIYNQMPDEFILTDADLQFNKNMPKNFVEILSELSNKYLSFKTGFALDISDSDKMLKGPYHRNYTIYEWEKRFWEKKIDDDTYEIYEADIDTTFCLINKKYDRKLLRLRIAGDFLTKHIPWYIENPILDSEELHTLYNYSLRWSTSGKLYKLIKRE